MNGRKLSDEECFKRNESMRQSYKLVHQLQDTFMEKIMSSDLTIIAQMIKNQVRPSDWNYLIRKSLYSSYEDNPYILNISPLYQELIKLVKKYNKHHKDNPLPHITPHTLRHTFCTRLASKNMNPKDLQYIMGHSNISITMNWYAHASIDTAKSEVQRLIA